MKDLENMDVLKTLEIMEDLAMEDNVGSVTVLDDSLDPEIQPSSSETGRHFLSHSISNLISDVKITNTKRSVFEEFPMMNHSPVKRLAAKRKFSEMTMSDSPSLEENVEEFCDAQNIYQYSTMPMDLKLQPFLGISNQYNVAFDKSIDVVPGCVNCVVMPYNPIQLYYGNYFGESDQIEPLDLRVNVESDDEEIDVVN